jgi:hypothetical protein
LFDKKLQLYPNPAKDEINIIVKIDIEEKGIIKILDIQGNVLYSDIVENSKCNLKVETSFLNSGVYIIKYSSKSGEEKIEKLIIAK